MGSGFGGEELQYDAYSVIDRSRPSSPVQMPAVMPDVAPVPAPVGFKSKMGNLFRKKNSPANSTRGTPNDLNGLGIEGVGASDAIPQANQGLQGGVPPYASSQRMSISSRASGPVIMPRSTSGATMMAKDGGPEAFAKVQLAKILRSFTDVFRAFARMSFILRPIDAIADSVPALEPTVVIIEMIMLMWLLYELSIVLEIITSITKRVCSPAILLGRLLGFGFKT